MRAATTLILTLAAVAAAASASAQPPDRQSTIVVYGDDPCPAAEEDEIVVCARRPEEERYRIPERFRHGDRPSETSWSHQAAQLEDAQRDTRPGSCSVVGSFGQSGCTQMMLRQWRAERRLRQPRR